MSLEPTVSLQDLLSALQGNLIVEGDAARLISGVTADSREVAPGMLFVALRGTQTDGHRFIDAAIARGAGAVLAEERFAHPPDVTLLLVPDTTIAVSRIADRYYGSPSRHMSVVGVTGTNGKTTVAHMIAAIFNEAGLPAGTLGTLGVSVGEHHRTLHNTTPLSLELQAVLAELRALGAEYVAMEVTSHALGLERVADVHFQTAVLTNVTRDHLDFHGDVESYARTKRRLFEMAGACVFNLDDPFGARWFAEFHSKKIAVSYALENAAEICAQKIELDRTGSRFTIGKTPFTLALPGRFNVSNALAAVAASSHFGVDRTIAARALARLPSLPGRMQRLSAGGIDVVVDYAHTPDALENALRALRETAHGRLWVVFGCGGDRDAGKRPQMGAIAAQFADRAIVTSDNPRTEDPRAIADAVTAGARAGKLDVELDRSRAIARAVADANAGDVVLIAGKGHERQQIVGTHALPFDDVAVARAALEKRAER
ncbi:MAG: UDP-N-acetylmuramoyl-L-alanyl-D-glutamate--2,6-diaminopimelate ligase [Candidatus Eremiobacteraeota bacterium]|nr:UDP-N-acetylmuramoyl-L-alanyl-D-glutamate--2,6-diaminopimelate ligase [Candidatus Eremiobacteraeota bacterium]